VTAEQEPATRAIDVYEAMARALKYNMDHKVELYNQALTSAELRAAHAGMLPALVASSGYAARSNDLGSSSFNLVTNAPNFGFSTSQDRRNQTADIVFSWNVLDFGLSYVRAQQAADKVLIAAEARRKVMHRIVEDVRTAYWKAVSAERLDMRLRTLEGRVRRALQNSKALSSGGDVSPITAVTYRRELIEVLRTVQELRRDLSLAKYQLSALMNLKPGARFSLHLPALAAGADTVRLGADSMIEQALQNRPELRDVAYRQRINAREAKAALLELLPGISLYAGSNSDHNSFLLNRDWVQWGAKASWNVMKLFTHRDREQVIGAQEALLDQRALAVTMAIMTQVHVSRARFEHFAIEQRTAQDYLAAQRELVGHLRVEHGAGRVSEQTMLREELGAIVAEAKADLMAANVQSSRAAIFTAIGLDLVPADAAEADSVSGLAQGLKRVWLDRGAQTASPANSTQNAGLAK
jgi:outer membrane protein TolC